MKHPSHSPTLVAGVIVSMVLALLAVGPASAAEVVIHVSPRGDDAWSGTQAEPNVGKTDGPVATLAGARDALRKARGGRPPAEPARIVVADGRYTLTDPLVLSPEDGGTAEAPVRYEAAPAEPGSGKQAEQTVYRLEERQSPCQTKISLSTGRPQS